MIAKQSVYLNNDRTQAVAEGHKDARFLLVREGHSIEDAELEKYDGAEKLVGGKAKGFDSESVSATNVDTHSAAKKISAKKSAK